MKRATFILGLVLVLSVGCDLVARDERRLEGEYQGTLSVTFHVGTDSARTEEGTVVCLLMEDGRHSVRGEPRYLLPRGGGQYEVYGGVVVFINTTPYPTDIDPTLLLSGPFDYEWEDGQLTMRQFQEERNRYRTLVLERIE